MRLQAVWGDTLTASDDWRHITLPVPLALKGGSGDAGVQLPCIMCWLCGPEVMPSELNEVITPESQSPLMKCLERRQTSPGDLCADADKPDVSAEVRLQQRWQSALPRLRYIWQRDCGGLNSHGGWSSRGGRGS